MTEPDLLSLSVILLVVRSEVSVRLVHQLIVGNHPGQDFLGIPGVNQHVSKRIVESRNHDDAARGTLGLYHNGIGVGRDDGNALILEPGSGGSSVISEIVQHIGPVGRPQGVRSREPEDHESRLPNHDRGLMLAPEPTKTYASTVLASPAGSQNQGQQAVPVQSHAPIMGSPGFPGESAGNRRGS